MKKKDVVRAVSVTLHAFLLSALSAFAATDLPNSITIDGFSVSYPDGWSTIQSGRLTVIVNAPADQQAALGGQFVYTPQVTISSEQRLDPNDALNELNELAAGAGPAVARLTLAGAPAIQWRKRAMAAARQSSPVDFGLGTHDQHGGRGG